MSFRLPAPDPVLLQLVHLPLFRLELYLQNSRCRFCFKGLDNQNRVLHQALGIFRWR